MTEIIDINTSMASDMISPRPYDMHKGQAGRVLIIAGSKGMAGAAILATRGCLYSGSGLVKVALPEELFPILQISVPEAMCLDRSELRNYDLAEYDAIAIGPGLGHSSQNMELFQQIFISYDGPLVIDADGINCLCKFDVNGTDEGDTKPAIELIRSRKGTTVLTPHLGEARRIVDALEACGEKPEEDLDIDNRAALAEFIAKSTNAIVLLKGPGTLICQAGACEEKMTIYKNPTGNPGMATGGSGDVLTGMIASLLGQKLIDAELDKKVAVAAFLHGLAGDIAAENVGEYGMTAADIADAVSVTLKEIV